MTKLYDIHTSIITIPRNKNRRDSLLIEYNPKTRLIEGYDGILIGKKEIEKELGQGCWYSPYNVPKTDKWLARMGCYLSHRKALSSIKNINEPMLVLEDDFMCPYGNIQFQDLTFPEDDWDILYLGGFATLRDPNHIEEPEENNWNQILPNKIKYWTSHAYIVREPIKLLKLLEEKRATTYDSWLIKHVQSKGKCYYHHPTLVYQNSNFKSSIDPLNTNASNAFYSYHN